MASESLNCAVKVDEVYEEPLNICDSLSPRTNDMLREMNSKASTTLSDLPDDILLPIFWHFSRDSIHWPKWHLWVGSSEFKTLLALSSSSWQLNRVAATFLYESYDTCNPHFRVFFRTIVGNPGLAANLRNISSIDDNQKGEREDTGIEQAKIQQTDEGKYGPAHPHFSKLSPLEYQLPRVIEWREDLLSSKLSVADADKSIIARGINPSPAKMCLLASYSPNLTHFSILDTYYNPWSIENRVYIRNLSKGYRSFGLKMPIWLLYSMRLAPLANVDSSQAKQSMRSVLHSGFTDGHAFNNIRYLKVWGSLSRIDINLDLIFEMPCLRVLEMIGIDSHDIWQTCSIEDSPIEEINFRGGMPRTRVISACIRACKALRSLRISSKGERNKDWGFDFLELSRVLDKHKSSLERLWCCGHNFHYKASTEISIWKPLGSLKHFEALHDLQVPIHALLGYPPNGSRAVDILPQHLHALKVEDQYSKREAAMELESLASCAWLLPDLKSVVVAARRYYWSKLTRENHDTLAATFATSGVEFKTTGTSELS